ncbi:MAG: hypothetical protein ABJG47_10630 [Ekhidna sp.]
MKDIQEPQNLTLCEDKLNHLKFEFYNDEYTASLIDYAGFEILRGYGPTRLDAINDLHKNLI